MREVLVLDDGERSPEFLDDLARRSDCVVTLASSGAEALERIVRRNKTNRPFDLFIVNRTPSSLPHSALIARIWGEGASVPILMVCHPQCDESELSALPGLMKCRPSAAFEMAMELLALHIDDFGFFFAADSSLEAPTAASS